MSEPIEKAASSRWSSSSRSSSRRFGPYFSAVIMTWPSFKPSRRSRSPFETRLGAGFADDLVGVPLMRRAFHPETDPLTDTSRVAAERDAEMALFAGAIGHAKNPPGHRDVDLIYFGYPRRTRTMPSARPAPGSRSSTRSAGSPHQSR
jgi:hypothetical protein